MNTEVGIPNINNIGSIHYLNFSRSGREKQVYDEGGARLVAGCIPIDSKTGKVLLISSRKRENRWVLPKGGWENDETEVNAAIRETWEEAGVKGNIKCFLGYFKQFKKIKKAKKPLSPKVELSPDGKLFLYSEMIIFEMDVQEVVENWPEKNERLRKWFTFEEAEAELRYTPHLREALLKCSIATPYYKNLNSN